MKTIKAYKYRIYPNATQKVVLDKSFGCARFYWNTLVAELNSYSNEHTPVYKSASQIRSEFTWMQEVSCSMLQQRRIDFDRVRNQYFNKNRKTKLGRIKFKRKNENQSFRMNNQNFALLDNKLKVTKLGYIKISIDRRPPENAKYLSVTISKNNLNEYYASVCFEYEHEPKIKQTTKNVGCDLGIASLLTLSDGLQFANPKIFRENQSELRRLQQHLSKKRKGSSRHNKCRIKVAKLYKKMTRQREWLLHNISKYVVTNYNEIALEDLSISSMRKRYRMNKQFRRALEDASMTKLKNYIWYKQQEYGIHARFIPRYTASSKECYECENVQKIAMREREFICTSCGTVRDRDLNAALVIQRKALGRISPSIQTLSDIKSLHPLVVITQLQ
ncbi:RNA-guided endonuclease TnpB family protein [Chryseobacterium phage MA9V-2]|nr:RNA-guided endonuclease TnpB family protein [Chryseobacterium phage MA9V-2]